MDMSAVHLVVSSGPVAVGWPQPAFRWLRRLVVHLAVEVVPVAPGWPQPALRGLRRLVP